MGQLDRERQEIFRQHSVQIGDKADQAVAEAEEHYREALSALLTALEALSDARRHRFWVNGFPIARIDPKPLAYVSIPSDPSRRPEGILDPLHEILTYDPSLLTDAKREQLAKAAQLMDQRAMVSS